MDNNVPEATDEVKIFKIAMSGSEIIGLGKDNKIYRWVRQAEAWELVGAK